MKDSQEKILDIKVNYAKAIKAIAEYQTKIDEAKDAEDRLKKQLKEGEISRQQYNEEMAASKAAINDYKDSIRILSKTVKNQLKVEKEQDDSLNSLRAQLSNLTHEYDSMSKAERESAEGLVLKDKINEVTDALKDNEEETQRYYRNVGNYHDSLEPLFDRLEKKLERQREKYEELKKTQGEHAKATKKQKKAMEDTQLEFDFMKESVEGADEAVMGFIANGVGLDASIIKMIRSIGSLGKGAKMAGHAVKALGKQLLALMANPIVAFLSLVSVALMAIVKGISSSEENTNRWKVALAPVTRILDSVTKGMQQFAGMILSVVEAGGKMIAWIDKQLEKLPRLGKYFAETNKQNKEYIRMAKERAAITKDTRDLEIQNAKDALKVATLKATADDELNVSAEKRMKAIKEANRIEEELSKKKYELAKRNYETMVAENAMAENTADTNDAIAQAEIEMYNALTEYQDKRGELLGREVSLANEIKQAEKDKADAAKEASDRRIEIKNKELEEIRKAEDEMIKLISDERIRESTQVETEYNRQIEDLKNRLQTEEDLTSKARESINSQIIALEQQKNVELQKLSDEALQEEIAKKEEEYKNLIEADKEAHAKMMEDIRIRYQTQIEEARGQESEIMRIKIEQKKAELDAIHQLEGESTEAFNLRKLEMENAYLDAKEDLQQREIEMEENKVAAIAGLAGNLSALLEQAGEDNKTAAQLAKVLAIAEIAIAQGVAIAKAVKTATSSSATWVDMLAAIATVVSSVTAVMGTAMKSVKSAKFAKGGLVSGPGTESSDSIPAQLSNGESVMTAQATSMFAPILSSFNMMGGGVPINVAQTSSQTLGEDMLARAVAKGVSELRPVVSVEEINTVSNRVKVLEDLGTK